MKYSIGNFSKISQLSIKTLRFYHEVGLLKPTEVDETTGYRYYNEKLLDKALVIHKLKQMDFSLKEIQEILINCTDDVEVADYMQLKLEEIQSKIRNYKKVQQEIQSIINIKKQAKMANQNNEVQIKQIDDMLIAEIRFKGKYGDVGKYFGELYKACARITDGNPFSMYYDEGYKEEDADIGACVAVKKEFEHEDIACRVLKGGTVYSILHKGPYDTIGESYKKLYEKITADNKKIINASREIYIKGPGMIFKGNPDNYLTELQFVVE